MLSWHSQCSPEQIPSVWSEFCPPPPLSETLDLDRVVRGSLPVPLLSSPSFWDAKEEICDHSSGLSHYHTEGDILKPLKEPMTPYQQGVSTLPGPVKSWFEVSRIQTPPGVLQPALVFFQRSLLLWPIPLLLIQQNLSLGPPFPLWCQGLIRAPFLICMRYYTTLTSENESSHLAFRVLQEYVQWRFRM